MRCAHRLGLAGALCAAVAGAPAARAQDATVVVTGRRQTPEQQARRFVRQVIATDTGQLARFLEPVCPLVLGAPVSVTAAIEDRLRRTGTAAGVRMAARGCKPNLVAAIAGDADAFIKAMRKRHGSFFAELSDVDLHDALRPGPVHSWRLVETRDENGAPVSGDPPMLDATSSSPFSMPTRAATVNAVVIFDKAVVLHKTIAQLADYVAMRTLAGARPPKGTAASDTILSLFDADAPAVAAMTPMDRDLLAGLYAISGDGNGMAQAYQIARRMAETPAGRRDGNGRR